MENFVVSARKYRPAVFEMVVGQKNITNTLKNAIKYNHLAQAFLFCGPRGVGKTTCARILAKTINCENITENTEACNECGPCQSFNESATFNIFELDAASNNSVEDIRNLVDQVRIPPQDGKFKVYIIDEVHMLSASAFNAFLKTLEEPPSYAKFILATTEKHKIIPTILSRCQIFDFKRISVDDITSHLSFVAKNEKVETEEDALHIIAQKADGALRDALTVFDQLVSFSGNKITYGSVIENLNVLDYDYYFKMTDHILKGDVAATLLLINEITENGFDGQHFIIGFGAHLRNLLICKDESTINLLELSPNLKELYLKQSAACNTTFLLKVLEINNNCDINYKSSNNKQLHLELALIKMGSLFSKKKQEEIPVAKTIEIKAPVTPQQESQKKTTIDKAAVKSPEKKQPLEGKSISNRPGTISIKDSINGKNGNAKNEEDVDESEKYINGPAEEFSQEQLENTWIEFMNEFTSELPNFTSALKKYQPKLKNDFIIEFTTDNKIIAKDREKIKKLQYYLRKKLNNFKIQLTAKVNHETESQVPYTDQEKYQKMLEKNPNLKNLKDKLNLEIDF